MSGRVEVEEVSCPQCGAGVLVTETWADGEPDELVFRCVDDCGCVWVIGI